MMTKIEPVFSWITDICILVEDLDASIAFYSEKMGLKMRSKAGHFADFEMQGAILALWKKDHMTRHTGVGCSDAIPRATQTMVAIQLERNADVDATTETLLARGIEVTRPRIYEWKAYCAYFGDPDGTIWELYSWDGGTPSAQIEPDNP